MRVFLSLRILQAHLLGAIAQFEKTSLVAKLKAARDRKKAETGKCGGRRSYAEAKPQLVALAKQLERELPRPSLRGSEKDEALFADHPPPPRSCLGAPSVPIVACLIELLAK
jgi:hypothetical protein